MSPELCDRFAIALPEDNELIEQFSALVDRLLSISKCKRIETQKLIESRNALFPVLVTEKVRMER